MRLRSVLTLGIITALLCSSFAATALFTTGGTSNGPSSSYSSGLAFGNVAILPNGTVSGTASVAVSHTAGSNLYSLTEGYVGNLTIERSGAIFNGDGFSIANVSSTFGLSVVNISNANNVEFLGTTILASKVTDLSFYNTTNDKASYLTMLTNTSGVVVGAKTSYINVSNSLISDNLTGQYAPVYSGTASGAAGPFATNNVSFYNLSVVENLSNAPSGYPPAFAIASPYTTLEASSITEMGQSGVGIGDLANNTKIDNNHIFLMKSGIGIENGLSQPSGAGALGHVLLNNTVDGNNIIFNNSTSFSVETGVFSNSQGSITNNVINGNLAFGLTGIAQFAPNSKISHNFVNVSGAALAQGIAVFNSSISVLNNVVFVNSTGQSDGITGQNQTGHNLNEVLVENNTVSTNGTESYGISALSYSLSNSSVSGNNIETQGPTSYGIIMSGNYTNVTHNNLFDRSTPGGSIANAAGIVYGISGSNINVNIANNEVHTSADNYSFGLYLLNSNQSSVSNNHVLQNVTQTTLNSSMLNLVYANHTLVTGNTFSAGENYTTFATYMIYSQNDTFTNNIFSGTSDLFNFSESGNNLFYHNNFLKYNEYGKSVNSTGNRFNLSYPVAGNYWGTSPALADKYSGPGQNLSGSDGIGDSPLTTTVGVDHYPLVYQWMEPSVTFTESGLPTGQMWTVVFNGVSYSSTNQTLRFSIVNGTYQNYSYTAEGTSLYYVQNTNGTADYSGSNLSLNVKFVHWAYLNGSVSPSTYTLYLNGTAVVYNSTSFNTTIRAGSYELEITSSGYSTYYENFTVSANQTEHINVNLTSNTPANGSNNSSIPRRDLYYAAGGVVAVVVVAAGAFTLRRRNIGK